MGRGCVCGAILVGVSTLNAPMIPAMRNGVVWRGSASGIEYRFHGRCCPCRSHCLACPKESLVVYPRSDGVNTALLPEVVSIVRASCCPCGTGMVGKEKMKRQS